MEGTHRREYYSDHTTMKTLNHHCEQSTRTGYQHLKSHQGVMSYERSSHDVSTLSNQVTVKLEPHEKLTHCELFRGKNIFRIYI